MFPHYRAIFRELLPRVCVRTSRGLNSRTETCVNDKNTLLLFIFNAFSWFIHGETAAVGPPHYRGFTITPRHTTLGRTPLDE